MVCSSLETAHAAVVQLVEDFAASEAHYLSPGYSEAQVRISFIDKLWQALGWDVTHEQQKNPYAQEVKVEDPRKIAGSARRADYAFHTAPNFRDPRFFCEAKKPSTQLQTDADAAFQTIRYGWSAGTPLAVLTDFEQLHILDCRAKPDIATALARSHRFFHYKEWLNLEKFAELYYLFSREAFRDGGFDAYVSKLPRPKKVGTQLGLLRTGAQPVDAAFLTDLEGYRETLAKLLKAADHTLDGDALTGLVQRILDRLVFLRFLEDKLIETEHQVQHFSRAAGGHAWAKFLATSRKLDARYNGTVFKALPELDTPGRLPVDDARFADLCEDLTHTKSPYDFNAIPIHILGSIYERFLGKVIVTTAERARVEEKPEVRKSGGVYYTPEYIVRYICEQTVGRLIEGKSPAQISKMRFADIACGSGSFLLGVYDLLLRTHGEWYNAHRDAALKEDLAPPDKSKKRKKEFIPAVVERDGVLRLTLEKKREILLNNVFGVDLDPQAVEVAQLSLYLKLLEDETTASAAQHYLDFHEALLPSLHRNVVRGNSLIGTDILFGQFEFSTKEERKLAPMDFSSAFTHVMREGGFDAIVGNPPWISLNGKFGNEFLPAGVLEYLIRTHGGNTYMPNMYEYFVSHGLELVRPGGFFSLIVPDRLGFNSQFIPLRHRIVATSSILALLYKVPFPGIIADTLVFLIEKTPPSASHEIWTSEYETKPVAIKQSAIAAHPEATFHYKVNDRSTSLIERFKTDPTIVTLSDLISCTSGFGGKSQLITSSKINSNQIQTLKGDSIGRYQYRKGYWFEFCRANITGRTTDPVKLGAKEKILIRKTGSSLIATIDRSGRFPEQSLYFLYDNRTKLAYEYLLGLINSTLMNWFFKERCLTNEKTIAQVKTQDLILLPIRTLDLKKPEEKKQHDRMVQLVEAMLGTQQQLAGAANENDRSYYETKAAGLDRQIDELTCDLYDLAPDERSLVAGNQTGNPR